MRFKVRALVVVAVIAIAVITMGTTALAAGKSQTTKPGWGNGDKHHVHTGPPGHSVRPGDDEHHGDKDKDKNHKDNHNGHNQGQNGSTNHGKNK